jgi:hypothetical protein
MSLLLVVISVLLLGCCSRVCLGLSECANNRSAWNPPLWQLREKQQRRSAFVLAVTPLDLPDAALRDAVRVAGAATTTYFMSLNENCSVADAAADAELAAHLDDASVARIGALVRRMQDALLPATYAALFAEWRATPLAVLAQRLSIYGAVLYAQQQQQQNDTAFVAALFSDAQLVPSTLDERLAARVRRCGRAERALESPAEACRAYVGVYDDAAVKQALVDALLPELEAVILRGVLPVRVVRAHQLSQAYRCGDTKALAAQFAAMGTDTWHEPLSGAAGDWLDEQVLFARNRRIASQIVAIVRNHSDSDDAPLLFVVDASNLVAPDRFGHMRSSLKAELEASGFRFNAIAANSLNVTDDQNQCAPLVTDAPPTPPPPSSSSTATIIYSVVTIALVIMIIAMTVVIVRVMRRQHFKRNVIVV